MIVSNATIYPRESNRNNNKNQHMDDSQQEEVQSCELAQPQIINAHPCLWLTAKGQPLLKWAQEKEMYI